MQAEQPPQDVNSAALPLVTLDNNALIAVRKCEPEADAVHELLAMNRNGQIVINITLSTGLEAGRGGQREPWPDHIAWLESLGIVKSNIFTGPRTLSFVNPAEPDLWIFDGARETQFNERIHDILFPNVSFAWFDYRDRECARAGLPITGMAEYDLAQMHAYIPPTPLHPREMPMPHYDALDANQQAQMKELHRRLRRTWDNAKNDALGLYNHLTIAAYTAHPDQSVFVTSDKNFLKPTKHARLRAAGFRGEILRPAEAMIFLNGVLAAVP